MRNFATGRDFGSSNHGAAAVEFAMIAAPFLVLIFATAQILLVSLARISLDYAVQSLAYQASNADQSALPSLLSKTNLCARSAFYLIDCQTDPQFCVSVQTFDVGSTNALPSPQCNGASFSAAIISCCYIVSAEYPLPLVFDPLSLLLSQGSQPTRRIIRSVALVYRS